MSNIRPRVAERAPAAALKMEFAPLPSSRQARIVSRRHRPDRAGQKDHDQEVLKSKRILAGPGRFLGDISAELAAQMRSISPSRSSACTDTGSKLRPLRRTVDPVTDFKHLAEPVCDVDD